MRTTLQVLAVIILTFATAIPVGIWLTGLGMGGKLVLYLAVFGIFAFWLFVVLKISGFRNWQNRFLGGNKH